MNDSEMKAMLGTEFLYYTSKNAVPIRAYVKAFDPEVGLSCYSLSDVDENSVPLTERFDNNGFEDDGTICLIGVDFKRHMRFAAVTRLKKIKETGEWHVQAFGGLSVNCAF